MNKVRENGTQVIDIDRLWTIHEPWIESIPIPGFRWNWNQFFTIPESFYSTSDSFMQKNRELAIQKKKESFTG